MSAGSGASICERQVVAATIYICSDEPTDKSVERLATKKIGERQASSNRGQQRASRNRVQQIASIEK